MRVLRQFVDRDRDQALDLLLKHASYTWDYSTIHDAYLVTRKQLELLRRNNIKMRIVIPKRKTRKKKVGTVTTTYKQGNKTIQIEDGIKTTTYANGTISTEPVDPVRTWHANNNEMSYQEKLDRRSDSRSLNSRINDQKYSKYWGDQAWV